MISRPVSSPHAPAGGCSVARAIPVISHSGALEPPEQLERPCTVWSGCSGCTRWNPGAARRSRRSSGCTSSSRTRAGRSPCRRRSSAARAACSGGRGRARPPREPGCRLRAASAGIDARARRARAGSTRADPAARTARSLTVRGRESPIVPPPRGAGHGGRALARSREHLRDASWRSASISSRVRRSVTATSERVAVGIGERHAGQEPALDQRVANLGRRPRQRGPRTP